ncbi:MAG: hypothetical protein KIT14_14285 [bacterium]|nr:hypothetical protein [bacterium]
MLPGTAHALHRETPGAVQITNGVSHVHSTGRSWGNYLTFVSSQDLAGTGNTTKQVFVFNLAAYDCAKGTTVPTTPCPPATTPHIWQLTTGNGQPDNPSAGTPSNGATIGDLWVAFDALGSFSVPGALSPLSGAAGNRRQIYLANLKTGEYRRVTTAADGDSIRPSVNVLAGVVVFESTATALSGMQNPSGTSQVYAYQKGNGAITRISQCATGPCNASGNSRFPNTNRDGTRIVFESTSDLMGNGHDTGVWQIYFADFAKNGNPPSSTLYRLTNGNASSHNPHIAENGPVVAFDTTATNLPGVAGGAGRRVVLANVSTPAAPTLLGITTPEVYGDCSYPALNPGATATGATQFQARVPMICTGDPLQNGTTGNRAFVYDTTGTLNQITGAGDVQGPLAANLGLWFMTVATSSDLTGGGVCGYQIYSINYNVEQNPNTGWLPATQIGQLPPDSLGQRTSSVVGLRNFEVLPESSSTRLTNAAGTTNAAVPAGVTIGLDIGAPSGFNGQAPIKVPKARVVLPPVPVPNLGAICMKAVGDGTGIIDCDGGPSQANVLLYRDHNIDDTDPSCFGGCREDDATCQGSLIGPHRGDIGLGVCNGPLVEDFTGSYAAGGARVSIPVAYGLSTGAGLDGVFCTADDIYSSVQGVTATLRLTTGNAGATIDDRDNVLMQSISAAAVGTPFECNRVRAGDLAGAKLVGFLPILDAPVARDVVLGFSLVAAPSANNSCGASCGSDFDCDDGDQCNGAETCNLTTRRCVAGTPLVCDDGNVCNGTEVCDPQQGCVAGTPCNDGNPCNGEETCSPTTGCQPGTPIVCTDGNACNGLETCNPANGQCVAGTAPVCDDGNPCTNDGCNPATGCTYMNNTNPCNDGSACTENDVCAGGQCKGTLTSAAQICNAGNGTVCDGIEQCSPATGACEATPLDCDDGNPCTDDMCDPVLGCQHVNNTASCNDGNLCTLSDVCSNGVCGGVPLPCGDGNACNGIETCNPTTGQCQAGTPPNCDDGDVCTNDACSVAVGCVYTYNTNPCDDGNACTGTPSMRDQCSNGACIPGAVINCNDGNVCNGTEICDPEIGCQAGTPLACNDGNPCNGVETCSPAANGCVAGNPLVCDDGNACNGLETCDPSSGCSPGTAPSCDDGNPCTADSCDPTAEGGCKHVPLDDVPCDDGSACTLGDVCTAGVCGGTPQECGDDNLCNGTETCNGQTGVCEAGTPVVCDDGDECTIDNPCDPLLGCSFTRVPNFVVCRLDQISSLVRAAQPFDVGGRKRQKVLLKRLAQARRRAQLGLIGTGNKAVQNLRRSDRRLQSFMGLLQIGLLKGRVQAEMGERLLGLASDTEGEITTLVRNTPR